MIKNRLAPEGHSLTESGLAEMVEDLRGLREYFFEPTAAVECSGGLLSSIVSAVTIYDFRCANLRRGLIQCTNHEVNCFKYVYRLF
jgi:hypothetical protein